MRGAKPGWSHSNTPSRSGVDGRDRAPCPTRASRIQETQEAAPRSPSRSLRRRREWLVGLRQPAHPSREIFYQNKSERLLSLRSGSFGAFKRIPKASAPPASAISIASSLSQQATRSKRSLACQSHPTAVSLAVDGVRGPQRHTCQTECAPKASRELGHLSRKRLKRRPGTSAARAWSDFRCAAAA